MKLRWNFYFIWLCLHAFCMTTRLLKSAVRLPGKWQYWCSPWYGSCHQPPGSGTNLHRHTTKENKTSVLLPCESWQKCKSTHTYFEQKDHVFIVSFLSSCGGCCHTEISNWSCVFKLHILARAHGHMLCHSIMWMSKYCTIMESDPETHPAHFCNQNITTTRPFSFTITITLNNIWPAANNEDYMKLFEHEFLEQPVLPSLCPKIPHRLLKIRGSWYFKNPNFIVTLRDHTTGGWCQLYCGEWTPVLLMQVQWTDDPQWSDC